MYGPALRLAHYQALLAQQIYQTLGKRGMSALTPERIRMWHAEVAKVGSTTAAQAYRLLHGILATATVEGTFARNTARSGAAGSPTPLNARSCSARTSKPSPQACPSSSKHSCSSPSGAAFVWASC